jgi:hypothetical protein
MATETFGVIGGHSVTCSIGSIADLPFLGKLTAKLLFHRMVLTGFWHKSGPHYGCSLNGLSYQAWLAWVFGNKVIMITSPTIYILFA